MIAMGGRQITLPAARFTWCISTCGFAPVKSESLVMPIDLRRSITRWPQSGTARMARSSAEILLILLVRHVIGNIRRHLRLDIHQDIQGVAKAVDL